MNWLLSDRYLVAVPIGLTKETTNKGMDRWIDRWLILDGLVCQDIVVACPQTDSEVHVK